MMPKKLDLSLPIVLTETQFLMTSELLCSSDRVDTAGGALEVDPAGSVPPALWEPDVQKLRIH